MMIINQKTEIMGQGPDTLRPQSKDAVIQAHEAAIKAGFNVGTHVEFRTLPLTGEVIGFNDIRHAGMRITGDRAPLLIKRSDGVIKEHSTGELSIVEQKL
jgi:hypothetical protein